MITTIAWRDVSVSTSPMPQFRNESPPMSPSRHGPSLGTTYRLDGFTPEPVSEGDKAHTHTRTHSGGERRHCEERASEELQTVEISATPQHRRRHRGCIHALLSYAGSWFTGCARSGSECDCGTPVLAPVAQVYAAPKLLRLRGDRLGTSWRCRATRPWCGSWSPRATLSSTRPPTPGPNPLYIAAQRLKGSG